MTLWRLAPDMPWESTSPPPSRSNLEMVEVVPARRVEELEAGLHKIAEFTSEHGGWTGPRTGGGVAGAIHGMARALLKDGER